MESLLDNKNIVSNVIEVVKDAHMPVSIDYVARNVNLTWASARAILFQLALGGRLSAQNTTKSWIFTIKEVAETGSDVSARISRPKRAHRGKRQR